MSSVKETSDNYKKDLNTATRLCYAMVDRDDVTVSSQACRYEKLKSYVNGSGNLLKKSQIKSTDVYDYVLVHIYN